MLRTFRILLVIFAFHSFATISVAAEVSMSSMVPDKKSEIEAYMRQARHFMEKGDYASAKRKLERVLELDKNHAEAKTLLAECEKKIETQKATELDELNRAVSVGTEQALRSYIDLHPDGFYIEQAENYLQDFNLWMDACQKGTKVAYAEYLAISNLKGYEKEAELAIKTIDAESAWDICKNNITLDGLEKFIKKYAGTPFEKEAKYELYLLKGEEFYHSGSHATALKYYEDANKIHSLTGQYLKHYRDLETEQQFLLIKTSNNVYELKDFLSRTSIDSPYYIPVSNRLALLLAQKLTIYSLEQDFEDARRYAKDAETRSDVEIYIHNVRQKQKERSRASRQMARRKRWEGKVKCGWNICDIYGGNDVLEVETGFRLRIGSNENAVNFMTGFDFQWFIYSVCTSSYYYNTYDTYTTSKLAIPASIRLNLGNNDFATYFGFGTVVWPNIATNQQATVAIEPQIGLSTTRMEISCSYRAIVSENELIPSFPIHGLFGYNIIFYF